MKDRKLKWLEALWYPAVFVFLYIWFAKVHPVVVYDADDWTYLSYVREALPIWGDWNPGKVFPEVVMPFLSTVGMHLLGPLVGDYVRTFTVVHALSISAFITVYVWCLAELLRRLFSLERGCAMLLSGLFLLFHFMVFRYQEANNLYMFHCVDLNCYYNYLIPALISAALLMFLMDNGRFDTFMEGENYLGKGLFWLAVYFAIFSNLTTSGILAAFAGSRLLLALIRLGKKLRIREYIRENSLDLMILGIWFASAVIELSGGRAGSNVMRKSIFERLELSAYFLKETIYFSSRVFWLVVGIITVLTLVSLVRSRGREDTDKTFLSAGTTVLVAGAAMLLYTLLLCAVVEPKYMLRSEYLFGIFFYGFLIVLVAAGYLLKRYPKLAMILPLLLVVLTSTVNTNEQTFQESNKYNVDPVICADISRDILEQVITASEAGERALTLYVPCHVADPYTQDNWPHTLVLMPRIAGALYKQGVIKNPITITEVIPSPEMNQRYGLPIPTND